MEASSFILLNSSICSCKFLTFSSWIVNFNRSNSSSLASYSSFACSSYFSFNPSPLSYLLSSSFLALSLKSSSSFAFSSSSLIPSSSFFSPSFFDSPSTRAFSFSSLPSSLYYPLSSLLSALFPLSFSSLLSFWDFRRTWRGMAIILLEVNWDSYWSFLFCFSLNSSTTSKAEYQSYRSSWLAAPKMYFRVVQITVKVYG